MYKTSVLEFYDIFADSDSESESYHEKQRNLFFLYFHSTYRCQLFFSFILHLPNIFGKLVTELFRMKSENRWHVYVEWKFKNNSFHCFSW